MANAWPPGDPRLDPDFPEKLDNIVEDLTEYIRMHRAFVRRLNSEIDDLEQKIKDLNAHLGRVRLGNAVAQWALLQVVKDGANLQSELGMQHAVLALQWDAVHKEPRA